MEGGGNKERSAYQIVYLTKAIATQRQFFGHGTHTILPTNTRVSLWTRNAKGKLARMRMLRGPVRYDHLRQRQAIEDRSDFAMVIVCDRGQSDPLAMAKGYSQRRRQRRKQPVYELKIHTNMHLPVLPFENMAIHLEAHPFRLNNVKRFEVLAKLETLFRLGHQIWQEVEGPHWRWDSLSVCSLKRVVVKSWRCSSRS
jgi:hypothetical protein